MSPPKLRVPSPSEVEEKYQPGDVVKTEGEVLPPKADPISSGPEKRPISKNGVPDIAVDYEGFFMKCLDIITHASDPGELETFWNQEIEPQGKTLMPPDYTELAEAYGRQQTKLNGDGE